MGLTPDVATFVYSQITEAERRFAQAIALGISVKTNRPQFDLGGLEIAYGTVNAIAGGQAYVALDSDRENPVPMSATGTVAAGQRVAVLLTPPSGAICLGGIGQAISNNPQVLPVEWTGTGTVTMLTGARAWTAPWPGRILSVKLSLGTAPTGIEQCIIDVNNTPLATGVKASIWNDPTDQPILVAGETRTTITAINFALFALGDEFTADVDSAAGADMGIDMFVVPR